MTTIKFIDSLQHQTKEKKTTKTRQDRQIDIQTDRQTDRQTDKQTRQPQSILRSKTLRFNIELQLEEEDDKHKIHTPKTYRTIQLPRPGQERKKRKRDDNQKNLQTGRRLQIKI